MFQLNLYLRAYDACLQTTPGKTELVVEGSTVFTTEDDMIHSIFQAADQHFVEKFPFLTRTNVMLLANKRQILTDLEKQGGNVTNMFQMLHRQMESTVKKMGEPAAPTIDISAFIEEGEKKAFLKNYSALVFPNPVAARKYYYTKCGTSIPEDAELEGSKISLRPAGSAEAAKLIQAIYKVLKKEGSVTNIDPKIKAPAGEKVTGIVNKKDDTLEAAVEILEAKWNDDSNTPEYKEMLSRGLTGDMLGTSLSKSIWNNLPGSGTLKEYIGATVDALKNKEKFISTENKEARTGPYGAATFLLARKAQLEKDGGKLKKREQ